MRKITNSSIAPLLLIIAAIFLGNACGTGKASAPPVRSDQKITESQADLLIKQARKRIRQSPKSAGGYAALAAGILKKVRETGDYRLNREAEAAIQKTLEIDSESFDARVMKIQILLSEHEFSEALELTRELRKGNPLSEVLMAAETDALTELGRYAEAVKSAQEYVDFRPNAASYTRAANLRSLHGDPEGAIRARKLALNSADPSDREGLAWYNAQIGEELMKVGRYADAEEYFDSALTVLPGYHWGLSGKGRARAARGDLATALRVFEDLVVKAPASERKIYLGDLIRKLGKPEMAREVYRETVRETEAEGGDMHRIALFWADNEENLDEALRIAAGDRDTNSDLAASDTLAWCLYKKGKFNEAREYSREARRLGTKSALFLYHAGMIESALGNRSAAIAHLEEALALDPEFDLFQADIARRKLEDLKGRSG